MPPVLTKSKLLRGFQCAKNLYLHLRRPELEPPVGPAQRAVFDQGTEVGAEARKLFPGGTLVRAKPWETALALKLTREAIARGDRTLFEAAFEHDGVHCRVDILHRANASDPWELIEVKSSTSVKAEHSDDLAIQSWVLQGAGIDHRVASVIHLNSRAVFPDLTQLFTREDITEQVAQARARVPERIAELRKALASDDPPAIDIGPQCSSPHDCPFTDHCWGEKALPSPNVLDLPSIGPRGWELYQQGVLALSDPRLDALTDLKLPQQRMIQAARTGQRIVDAESIARDLASWKWPLHYLDFETVNPAIPRFRGTRPYQQIPFQFSLHFQLKPDGELAHFEYLHDDETDPRPRLLAKLLEAIASEGSVVSYNKRFEGDCLLAMADCFPEHGERIRSIVDRLVDPWPVVKAAVYDPGFMGSFSIKAVAPALLGESLSYEGMEVGDGVAAQLAFAELTSTKTSPARREKIKGALLQYCKQDTLAMVLLVQWLYLTARRPQTQP